MPTVCMRQLKAGLDAQEPQQIRAALSKAIETIESMNLQIENLLNLARAPYRRKSEKVLPGQLAFELMGFLAVQSQQKTPPSKESDTVKKPKRKKRPGRIKLLPVDKVVRELDEQERSCSCGKTMDCIGHDVRRQIVHRPQELRMLEEHLAKYACGRCKDGVNSAKGTPKPIEKGLASNSLLAHMAVAKTLDATPIERIGRQLARHGIDIAASTLHAWFGRTAELCRPVATIAQKQLLASDLISLDDTRLLAKARDEDDPKTVNGRLWLYISDLDQTVFCQYTPDWKGIHPREVLDGYTGIVQSDGYAGLNPMFEGPSAPQRIGCNDHSRRKFVEALRQGDQRAKGVVDIYNTIYAIERQAITDKLKPPEVLALRQEKSTQLWQKLREEIGVLGMLASKKSLLGKALRYWNRQEPYLGAFLADGALPVSNAHVERLIRTVALFRKNSLFVGNVEAGGRYAALLTAILNCIIAGINPYAYLSDVLSDLAALNDGSSADHLMPRAWASAKQLKQQN